MDTAANVESSRPTQVSESPPREEGYLHYLAREGRWALRWCIGLCIIGIVITMITPLWFVAFVPAGVMLLCGILLVVANYVEKRSDRVAHDVLERAETAPRQGVVDNHAEDDRLAAATQELVKRESKAGLIILFVAVLAALLVAFVALVAFGQREIAKIFPIAALVVFAYMLLLMAPVWLGWFNEDIEQAGEQLEDSEE